MLHVLYKVINWDSVKFDFNMWTLFSLFSTLKYVFRNCQTWNRIL